MVSYAASPLLASTVRIEQLPQILEHDQKIMEAVEQCSTLLARVDKIHKDVTEAVELTILSVKSQPAPLKNES